MKKRACAFFGHRNYNYKHYEDSIRERIVDLINRGVTEFYNGYRGEFDILCARIVHDLQTQFSEIKNILVLSYFPDDKFVKPNIFDETVYLLEKRVPLKYAIAHTNRKLVQSVDYIISGVVFRYGGAKAACDYAQKLYKTIFYIVDNYTYCDCDFIVAEWQEKMKDEEYRKAYEKEAAEHYQATRQVEEKIAKLKKTTKQ